MKSRLLFLAILALAAPALAEEEPYGWTIGASSTDPFVNTTTPTNGLRTYYLWLACTDVPDYSDGTPRIQGMTTAEFGFESSGISLLVSETTFPCQLLPDDQTFFCPQCPEAPFLVANILALDLPGSICFAPSFNGVMGTVDCETTPEIWSMDWVGVTNSGGKPCHQGSLCDKPIAVSDRSWGRMKSMYR